jgi:plasmid segregation protein ParM
MTAGALPGSGLVALLDIGSYTTDYLVFDVRGGQPVPVSECCGSIEAGVRQR